MQDFFGQVTIVVPCFNEARRLDVLAFQSFAQTRRGLRFLFVNDGSTDDTARIIESLRDNAPRSFETLHLPQNCGKADAVRRGMLHALTTGSDYVGFWDADLATPLEMIDAFCRVLEVRPELEMVFGTRIPLLGHSIQRASLRGLIGRCFALVTSFLLGFRVRDTQCGAKLFRSSLISRSIFQIPFQGRWIFDIEIIARLISASRHYDLPPIPDMIYEFPVDRWYEIAGGTIRSRDFARAIADLLVIYWRYLRPGADTFVLRVKPNSIRAADYPRSGRESDSAPAQRRAA